MKYWVNLTRSYRRDQAGVALVEFSLLLPVLFFSIFGMIEYSRVIYQQHIADKGVKNAARYLARIVDDTDCALNGAEFTAARTNAVTLAQFGRFDSNGTPLLSNWTNAADVTITIDCELNTGGEWRGEDDLPLITVSTAFNYDDLGLLGVLGQNGITVRASHQEIFVGG